MKSYMYTYGYKKPAKARETLAEKNPADITCKDCGSCGVSCAMGFDVPKKWKNGVRYFM